MFLRCGGSLQGEGDVSVFLRRGARSRYFCKKGGSSRRFASGWRSLVFLQRRENLDIFAKRMKFSILRSRGSVLDIFTQGETYDVFLTGEKILGKRGKILDIFWLKSEFP